MAKDYMSDDKLWDDVGLALLERIELVATVQRFREMLVAQNRLLDDAFHALDSWTVDGLTSDVYKRTMMLYARLRDSHSARRDAWQLARKDTKHARDEHTKGDA